MIFFYINNLKIFLEGDNLPRSEPEKLYNCHLCDYKCSKKYNLDRHLLTCKHLKVTQGDEENKRRRKRGATKTEHYGQEI